MEQATVRRNPLSLRRIAPVALALAVLASCAGPMVVWRAYNMCDVGVNATANMFGLVLVVPVLLLTHAVVLSLGHSLLKKWVAPGRAHAASAVLLSLGAVAAVSWAYFVLAGLPLQNALCPAGEPPWWPNWIPPRHDVYP
ncbi:hypothetical protein [Micromonospora inyonensis]|uniref:Uncharacterized protein n=1 Tax=Micromonospora inyonensis TaxID=47866 RepID=A0A1C6RLV1_9ACTN|nr:hypothetical protein [Micromonospora inyonensis]SCL18099.1 hypothetical protein GA0074694_2239 [Micromonospora inyonensis]